MPTPAPAPPPLPMQLLLLADSRLPAGTHAHSGGLEPAAAAGTVTDVAGLADFLRGRLATTGLVTAALAAAACALALADREYDHPEHDQRQPDHPERDHREHSGPEPWARLDAEADARLPSPAARRASRAQGRSLLRAVRAAWAHPALDAVAGCAPPHHPLVLGAAVAAAGGTPAGAASITGYGSVTGPASAAVRLLGLDPLAVHRVLADLAPLADAIAARAAAVAGGDPADLPACSAPALDLYAELHLHAELRLFES